MKIENTKSTRAYGIKPRSGIFNTKSKIINNPNSKRWENKFLRILAKTRASFENFIDFNRLLFLIIILLESIVVLWKILKRIIPKNRYAG